MWIGIDCIVALVSRRPPVRDIIRRCRQGLSGEITFNFWGFFSNLPDDPVILHSARSASMSEKSTFGCDTHSEL